MKKFLLTIAAIAACGIASAQNDVLTIDKTKVSSYKANAVLTSAEETFTVTLGNDTYSAKDNTEDTKIADAGWTAQVSGGTNPTYNYKKTTIDATTNEEKITDVKETYTKCKVLPEVGCYYIIESTAAGYIRVNAILNASKQFYIIEKTAEDAKIGGYNGKVIVSDKLDAKAYGKWSFAVEADKQYYVFCEGSKLGLMGVEYSDNSFPTAIKGINADAVPAGKAVKTVEDGKIIIIRDGAKYDMSGRKL